MGIAAVVAAVFGLLALLAAKRGTKDAQAIARARELERWNVSESRRRQLATRGRPRAARRR